MRTLLERSFTVVGTVRSRAKGEYVKKKLGQYGDKFEYVVVEDIGTVSGKQFLFAVLGLIGG